MATRFLSDEQRRRYGRYAGEPSEEQLARHFHLDAADREVIALLRGAHNRLGFAAQLGTVRFLGVFLDDLGQVPHGVIADIAHQLGEQGSADLASYGDGRQRWRHVAMIRERHGFRDFAEDGAARFRLARWLYTLAWTGDDRPSLLFDRATSWLAANKILLPGATTLERFVARIRHRAQRRLWRVLAGSLDDGQRARIQGLLDEDGKALSTLDDLRRAPARRMPTEFIRHLERIDAIRSLGLVPKPPGTIPATTIQRLARFARVARPSAILALPEPRRTATIAALFSTLEAAALDDAVELFEALVTDVVSEADTAHRKARLRTLRDLDAAALRLRDVVRLAIGGEELPLDQWREALFTTISETDITAAMALVETLACPPDTPRYAELRARWRRVHRLFSGFLPRVTIGAAPGGQPVREALDYLRGLKTWTGAGMTGAPTGVIGSAWKRHVLDDGGQVIDGKAYVFAVLEAFRRALKRRDVFIMPGLRFADPRRGLLVGEAWESARLTVCRSLGRSADAEAELAGLGQRLDRAWRQVASGIAGNAALRIETRDGKDELVVRPLDKLDRPPSLVALQSAVQGRLPNVDLPDILLEIAARTGFAEAFTHVSERKARVEAFLMSLCAVLVAEACNIGFEPMVRSDQLALGRARLSWVQQNFIRVETITAANQHLVAAQNALPIARIWGAGEGASADGIRFVAPSHAGHAGPNPKYFGAGRGITYYNLVSDQFTGFNAVVVPGTLRDSLLILGLLLDQETELEPAEIMTDTAAYADSVFGLFWLLGYQFSPRLADIGGARLWRIDRGADYGPLADLARHRIDTGLIERHWDDLLRLAGSLRLGHVQAGSVMRMLQVKDRPTGLARALAELGRIVKTLHVLGYVHDEEKRRRILTQLNRHEFRHRLARRVCHGERGEIRRPYRQGQEEQLGALGLVLNIIALWNATYIQATLDQLASEGWTIDPADVARISPLTFRHINFLGRYTFELPKAVAEGALRPLRKPSSE
jgi:TnpA family transposase